MTDAPSIQILVTPDFQGQLRKLAKRYRNIRADLQLLFDDLERGNCPGDQISGTTYTAFKVRVKNSDIRKGKNSGYRAGSFHSQGSLKMLEFQASSNGSSDYASPPCPHPCCY